MEAFYFQQDQRRADASSISFKYVNFLTSAGLSTADEYYDYPNPETPSVNTSATETTSQQTSPGQSTTLDPDEYYNYPSHDIVYDASVTTFEQENIQTQSTILMDPVISACF